jgi:prepilin-type N-terminal cleavage/methylation domain-containing protein
MPRTLPGLRSRRAFSLIEMMIGVTVMAIIASVVIPRFVDTSNDAKESTLRFNLRTLRSQVNLYKVHHYAQPPDGTDGLKQLIRATNADGVVGDPGRDYPFGPYLSQGIPANPFTNSSRVIRYFGAGTPPPSGAADAAWIYRPTTGDVWVDNPKYIAW